MQASTGGPPGFYPIAPWRAFEEVKLRHLAGFQGVVATSRNDAWAIGQEAAGHGPAVTGGFALHWNGVRWVRVGMPVSRFIPVSVSARGSSGTWIFGYQADPSNVLQSRAYAAVWNHGRWQVIPLPSGPSISWTFLNDLQSAVVSGQDVWVIGTSYGLNETHIRTMLWNWDGSGWTSSTLPAAGPESLAAVPGATWVTTVAGRAAATTAWEQTGSGWRRYRLPYVSDGTVAIDSPANAWIAGGSSGRAVTYMLHWNGHRWTRSRTPLAGDWGTATSDGHTGVWFGQWTHETGGRWYEPTALPSWRGCAGSGADAVVAPVPGTTALWLVDTCLTAHDASEFPVIGIRGRL